ERERGIGRLAGRLDHHRAAGRERGPGLARDHGVGEVPRRNQRAHADRLLHDEDALVGLVRRNDVAVGALSLLREPLDEGAAMRGTLPSTSPVAGLWTGVLLRPSASSHGPSI